jgi:hypothetical protein
MLAAIYLIPKRNLLLYLIERKDLVINHRLNFVCFNGTILYFHVRFVFSFQSLTLGDSEVILPYLQIEPDFQHIHP